MTAKDAVIAFVRDMPDDASLDQILAKLADYELVDGRLQSLDSLNQAMLAELIVPDDPAAAYSGQLDLTDLLGPDELLGPESLAVLLERRPAERPHLLFGRDRSTN